MSYVPLSVRPNKDGRRYRQAMKRVRNERWKQTTGLNEAKRAYSDRLAIRNARLQLVDEKKRSREVGWISGSRKHTSGYDYGSGRGLLSSLMGVGDAAALGHGGAFAPGSLGRVDSQINWAGHGEGEGVAGSGLPGPSGAARFTSHYSGSESKSRRERRVEGVVGADDAYDSDEGSSDSSINFKDTYNLGADDAANMAPDSDGEGKGDDVFFETGTRGDVSGYSDDGWEDGDAGTLHASHLRATSPPLSPLSAGSAADAGAGAGARADTGTSTGAGAGAVNISPSSRNTSTMKRVRLSRQLKRSSPTAYKGGSGGGARGRTLVRGRPQNMNIDRTSPKPSARQPRKVRVTRPCVCVCVCVCVLRENSPHLLQQVVTLSP